MKEVEIPIVVDKNGEYFLSELKLSLDEEEEKAMPKFLEKKLKSEYGAKSDIPYKVMNSIGAMKGNKETEKGRAMEARHEAHKSRIARSQARSKGMK